MNTETIRLLETIRQLLADTLTHADAIGEHVIAANVSMALELSVASPSDADAGIRFLRGIGRSEPKIDKDVT